jgi:hypothetical protein
MRPRCFLLHDGVDQTSWHTIAHVHAPIQFKAKQNAVAAYLLQYLKTQVIHAAVEFYYYEPATVSGLRSGLSEVHHRIKPVQLTEPPDEEAAEVYQGDVFAIMPI